MSWVPPGLHVHVYWSSQLCYTMTMCIPFSAIICSGPSLNVSTPERRGNSPIAVDTPDCEYYYSRWSTVEHQDCCIRVVHGALNHVLAMDYMFQSCMAFSVWLAVISRV